jgi:hypothetical protein
MMTVINNEKCLKNARTSVDGDEQSKARNSPRNSLLPLSPGHVIFRPPALRNNISIRDTARRIVGEPVREYCEYSVLNTMERCRCVVRGSISKP